MIRPFQLLVFLGIPVLGLAACATGSDTSSDDEDAKAALTPLLPVLNHCRKSETGTVEGKLRFSALGNVQEIEWQDYPFSPAVRDCQEKALKKAKFTGQALSHGIVDFTFTYQ
jgi:hypothetical protein